MRRISIVIMLLLAISLVPFASAALPEPVVTFIPSNISVNSSFLMLIDPGEYDSVRASWYSFEAAAYGLTPKVGDKYVCYFSDTDTKNTCGPTPFRYTVFNPYLLEISTTDSSGDTGSKDIWLTVGGIKLTSKITKDVPNDIVYINIWANPDTVTGISYKTYYAGNISAVPGKYGNLDYDAPTGAYRENLTLGLGNYYIAFTAPAGSDYGGMVERVSMSLTGDNGGDDLGYVDIDPISLNLLIDKNYKYTKSNLRISNLMNNTLTSLSVNIPTTDPIDINDYLKITPDNTTIGPYDFIYYTLELEHVDNSMDIVTRAEVSSNNTIIGYIPIDIKVSVKNESGSTMVSCQDKSDGADCLGGICCGETCRKKANCCDDSDCSSSEECDGYKCVDAGTVVQDILCSSGTCSTVVTSCLSSEEQTGTCRVSGTDGICCAPVAQANECDGEVDGSFCDNDIKVCCGGECVNCCSDSDCEDGKLCEYTYCVTPDAPEFDLTIPLIIAVIAIGGVGAFLYFTKFKKKGGEDDEFGGEEKLEDEFY